MASKTFKVEDIHCGSCENTIREALGGLEGVTTVEPVAATNEVTVVFDEAALDAAGLAERLNEAGYPVVA